MRRPNGQILGGFKILGGLQAGAGSQGCVYRAVCENAQLPGVPQGMVVALKVMDAQDDDDSQWQHALARVQRMQEISHPHVVKYFGGFSEGGVFKECHIVVEEYLEGETLKDRLAASPSGLDVDEAISIIDAVLSGLEYAAEHGVAHRDVKPGNVFLCKNGEVKLIDFEVAKIDGVDDEPAKEGNIRGSFDYLAPDFLDETFHGDVGSDVFSAGVVFHEMLCGRLPYPRIDGDRGQAWFTFLSRWKQVREGKASTAVNPRIKRVLSHADAVIMKALAVRREDRYSNFTEFRNGLRTIRFRELRHGDAVYRLLRFIGKGGFGEVYKARHQASGRDVAVKRLLKMNYAERFYREARIMKQLRDPCFVQFFDFFVLGDGAASEAFLVMAYLDGMPGNSLRDAIRASKAGGLPMLEVFTAFSRYAHGLAIMHRQGLYHRDIKPSNLYFPQGKPALAAIMDLGIARDEKGTVTHGQVPGTWDYMPPEVVVSDNRGDSRMDVYALGLCFYEALTGELGYPRLSSGSAGLSEFFARAHSGKPPVFSHPLVANDAKLLRLLNDMTNIDVARRLGDAEEVARRIAALMPAGLHERQAPSVPPSISAPPSPTEPPSPVPAPPSAPSIRVHRRNSVSRRSSRGAPPRLDGGNWRPALHKFLNFGIVAAVLAVLVVVCYWAYPAIKLKVARSTLDSVCEIYRTQTWEAGTAAERAWMARWAPNRGAWLELSYPSYVDCTNGLAAVKAEARSRLEEERRKAELNRERNESIEKLKSCRRIDGRLDDGRFAAIAEWELPERLKGDPEALRIMEGLGKVVAASVRAKLEMEPLFDRRLRIAAAKKTMENPWSKRAMAGEDWARLEQDIVAAETCAVGVVGNSCDEPIEVNGTEIHSGGTQTVVVRDGKTEAVRIKRKGYRSIGIPKDFDGGMFQVRSTMFVALPTKVEVPSFDGGIVCAIDGMRPESGVVELLPGPHICVYSREGYEDQRARFNVMVNVPVVLPGIGEWLPKARTGGRVAIVPASNERQATDEVRPKRIPDDEGLDPRAMLRRSVRRQCAAKLAVEPIENRQERLDEAGTILTRAVAIDHSLTEDEAKTLYAAIEVRRKWVAGKVVNETKDELMVGGRAVAAEKTVMLVFEDGLPEKWTVERHGYVTKNLLRNFDGVTLRLADSDFSALDVTVRLPALEPGVVALLDGMRVTQAFPLKPGEYGLIYQREGCRSQNVRFKVEAGMGKVEVPPPGAWIRSEATK